ncbi:hypothetical protein [Microbacterium sp. Ag1]|uniref:hypothetical protein n=1 Tax=Microbacterium sp. Ag1 TaxID=1643443 RepID=UPI000629C4D3|nr:hypothetical protein [Microbacterium sp. Ag1]KKX99697.1 hypothetical protein AAY78_00650 [Microbacterium sp. Ag1]
MIRRPALALALVLSAVLLASCAGSDPQADLEQDCVEQVAEKAGVAESDVVVTERIKNPAGSLDWRGTYPGGEFGCAGAMDADELFQVLTFDN